MKSVNSFFIGLPVFSDEESKRLNIIDSAINFIKLITVTEQFGFRTDPLFGFRVLDYEFLPNIPYQIRQDLQPVIENKMTIFNFLSQQIEDRLCYYFPEAFDFVSKIEVRLDESNLKSDMLQQQIAIIIHFKPPEAVSNRNREEYKISLNTLKTIT